MGLAVDDALAGLYLCSIPAVVYDLTLKSVYRIIAAHCNPDRTPEPAQMQITIDTAVDSPAAIRDACALLLTTIGVLPGAFEDSPDAVADGARSPIPPPPPTLTKAPTPPIGPGASTAPTADGAPPAVPVATGSVATFHSSAPPPPPAPPQSGGAAVAAASPAIGGTSAAPSAGAAASLTERDSAGLPWDARIHQSGKGRKKDGTWKIKKNCDPTLVQTVVRELTAGTIVTTMTARQDERFPTGAPAAPAEGLQVEIEIPAPPATVPLPPGPASSMPVPAVDNGTTAAAVSVAGNAAPVPAAPAAPAAAVPATGVGPTFRDLVARFGAATREGKIKPEEVGSICQQAGAPNLMSLVSTPDLIANVDALLTARLMQ